jgi:hypothetical protein
VLTPVILYGNSSHVIVSNYAPGSPDSYTVGVSNTTTPATTVTLNGIYLSYTVTPFTILGPGAPIGAQVQINTNGALLSTATDPVTLTITGPNSYLQTVTQAAIAGAVNFSQIIAPSPVGAYTYTFTFANNTANPTLGSLSTSVNVVNQYSGATTYPTPTLAGVVNSMVYSVTDQNSNLVIGFTGTVTVTCPTCTTFTTLSHTFTAGNGGQYTFSFAMVTPGTQTLVLASQGLATLSQTVVVTTRPTAVTLAVTPASPQAQGTVLTLTATATDVTTSAYLTAGQVNIYDAGIASPIASPYLIPGSSTGAVSIKVRLGAGSHSLTAQYPAEKYYAASTSAAVPFTITAGSSGTYTVTPTIATSGTPGNYTIISSVSSSQQQTPPGTINIINTTANNQVLGTANISTWTPGNGTHNLYTTTSTPVPLGAKPSYVATGDFNNDGIPDLAVVNDTADTVSILLGNGDGTFTDAANPDTAGRDLCAGCESVPPGRDYIHRRSLLPRTAGPGENREPPRLSARTEADDWRIHQSVETSVQSHGFLLDDVRGSHRIRPQTLQVQLSKKRVSR